MSVQPGVDRFLAEERFLRSMRFALVTNNGACTASYIPSRQALLERGYRIVKLFSPEHGIHTIGRDGCSMADEIDPLTGLPVKSLYGDELEPGEADLSGVDAVLLDLPDVGCRCYTYLWTLSHVMEACCRLKRKLILLDRPNPISGILHLAEGPALDESRCASFIGRWNIPLRHSCTYGELALLWRASRLTELDLDVVRALGWRREMFYPDWPTSFVPPSPAITNGEACLLYPGLCLLEATNLSEGRGTPLAFRVAGAPWMDAIAMAKQYNQLGIPGVAARAVTFVPESGKYRAQNCQGVMLHVNEIQSFRPVLAAVMLIKLVKDAHPGIFAWSTYPTHVNPSGKKHLDKLFGVADAESLFEQRADSFAPSMRQLFDCSGWELRVRPHLLYA